MFLTDFDYKTAIRTNIRDMVSDSDALVRTLAERTAVEEITSFLNFRYDAALIFAIQIFDHVLANTYKSTNWVIDATGTFYFALQDIPASKALTDTLFWLKDENKTPQIHTATTQFLAGDTVTGSLDEKYLVIKDNTTTGQKLTDKTYFQLKRSDLLVMIALDLAIYHLHTRINAKQTPNIRIDRNDQAIQKLKDIRTGKMQPNLPIKTTEITAATGAISIKSNTKKNNKWEGAATTDINTLFGL